MGFKHMKMYEYLVAFDFSEAGHLTPSKGTVIIYRKKKIKTAEDIREIAKCITDRIDGATNVGIYNFILLGRNRH